MPFYSSCVTRCMHFLTLDIERAALSKELNLTWLLMSINVLMTEINTVIEVWVYGYTGSKCRRNRKHLINLNNQRYTNKYTVSI